MDFPEELSVPLGDGPRTINADMVAVMWSNLYDNTTLLPLAGVLAMLVLDCYLVTRFERMERFAGT